MLTCCRGEEEDSFLILSFVLPPLTFTHRSLEMAGKTTKLVLFLPPSIPSSCVRVPVPTSLVSHGSKVSPMAG